MAKKIKKGIPKAQDGLHAYVNDTTTKKTVVTDNDMQDKMRKAAIEGVRQRAWSENNADSSARAKSIKAGLFKERDGDLYPTQKYLDLNSTGRLNRFWAENKLKNGGKVAKKPVAKKPVTKVPIKKMGGKISKKK